MHFAVIANQFEVAKLLLERGARVNSVARGFQPLHLAGKYGDARLVQLLVKAGADLEGTQKNALGGETPLGGAIGDGNEDAAAALIAAGASLKARDNFNRTLLHEAAGENLVSLVIRLAKKLDVNATTDSGETPLHYAASGNHVEAIDALLKLKAKRDALAKSSSGGLGGAPLHTAADQGHVEAIDRLLKAGTPVDLLTSRKRTALYVAAQQGHLNAVKALVNAGANVNAREPKYGLTPLLVAAQNGKTDVVKFLISKGADVHARTKASVYVDDPKGAMKGAPAGSGGAVFADIQKNAQLKKLFANT